jgi:hypothetical protein
VKGADVIAALKKKFAVATDRALAAHLGITTQAIQNWKRRRAVTTRQIAGLLHRATSAGVRAYQADAIRPLVEFFRIERCSSRHGARFEIFSSKDGNGRLHPYRSGLRDELDIHHGVYLFFDSRGQVIYAGKACRQSLWKEINIAFNRERGEVQRIKRVRHPSRKQPYRTTDEKARQIRDYLVPLHELAAYVSAYEVADSMIDDLEAMLVRSFANDLLNVRMERFTRHRRNSP